MKKIVMVGAGSGGIVAAHSLRSRLGKKANITLIERTGLHTFAPSLLWLAVGKRRQEQITRPLRHRKGINLILGNVSNVDWNNRRVQVNDTNVPYDYLVLAPGAAHYPERLPGFSEAALDLYSLDGAVRIRDSLKNFTGGTVVILVSALPSSARRLPMKPRCWSTRFSKLTHHLEW